MTVLRFLVAVGVVGGLALVVLWLIEDYRYRPTSRELQAVRLKLAAAEKQRQVSDVALQAQRAMLDSVVRGFGGRP